MTGTTEASYVDWRAPSRANHPARDAAFRSYDAVIRKDKQAWLANFADDGWIEDPIGASGMLRFAEAAMQVMGRAGEHQVDGARKALGHAYGGGSQFFAMWVVGADKP